MEVGGFILQNGAGEQDRLLVNKARFWNYRGEF